MNLNNGKIVNGKNGEPLYKSYGISDEEMEDYIKEALGLCAKGNKVFSGLTDARFEVDDITDNITSKNRKLVYFSWIPDHTGGVGPQRSSRKIYDANGVIFLVVSRGESPRFSSKNGAQMRDEFKRVALWSANGSDTVNRPVLVANWRKFASKSQCLGYACAPEKIEEPVKTSEMKDVPATDQTDSYKEIVEEIRRELGGRTMEIMNVMRSLMASQLKIHRSIDVLKRDHAVLKLAIEDARVKTSPAFSTVEDLQKKLVPTNGHKNGSSEGKAV